MIETFIFQKNFIDCQARRMYPRISLGMLATIARRHTPSGQRYEWVGGTSPHGVFDTHIRRPPSGWNERVTNLVA